MRRKDFSAERSFLFYYQKVSIRRSYHGS